MGCAASKDGQDAVKVDDGKSTLVGTELTKPEDIIDFPVFPEGTKSLVCKHLSKQVWHQLKDK